MGFEPALRLQLGSKIQTAPQSSSIPPGRAATGVGYLDNRWILISRQLILLIITMVDLTKKEGGVRGEMKQMRAPQAASSLWPTAGIISGQ